MRVQLENDNVQPSIEMLIKITRFFNVSTDYLLDLDEKSKVGSDDLIYQTVAYISGHFRENITLDKMAKDLCVSKYAISRVFCSKNLKILL